MRANNACIHGCPDVAKLNSKEWYFFSFRDGRDNRATISGYWKSIGKGQAVLDERTRAIIGKKEKLIFYKNNGIKTGWVMHEFLLNNPQVPPSSNTSFNILT